MAIPVRLEAGDIIVFPQGDAHVLSSAPGMRYRPDSELVIQGGETQLPFGFTFGGNGPEGAHIVCGFLGCEARPFFPLLEHVAADAASARCIRAGERLARLVHSSGGR